MVNYSKLTFKIKQQIRIFTNKLTYGLFRKCIRRAIHDVIYGIQASKDIKISNISRSLRSSVRLLKIENRLCNNLNKLDFHNAIGKRILSLANNYIKEDTVIACDLGDITKRYANKMKYISKVRDGSTGKIGNGYHLIHIAAADVKGEIMIPLYLKLFSSRNPQFVSENKEVLDAIDFVKSGIAGKGIWAIDRGADRKRIICGLIERNCYFVIRLKGDRHFKINKDNKIDKKSSISIANNIECKYHKIIKIKDKKDIAPKKVKAYIGYQKVIFLDYKEEIEMTLVVIKIHSRKPIILLTNLPVSENQEALKEYTPERILEIYLTRWKCEENYRFLKVAYNVEDIRVLNYLALNNIITLLLCVFYFICVFIGTKSKLNILLKEICEKAQRFFQIPEYKWYAVSDGIYKILFSSAYSYYSKPPPTAGKQMLLFSNHPEYYFF